GVLLTDGDQHVVAFHFDIGLAGRHQTAAALLVVFRGHLLEHHAGQAAVAVLELLRHEVIEDRDALMHRVLFLPGRRLHLLEAAAHDDGDLLAAQTLRRAAAIHRRVAATQHDDAAPDPVDMAKGDAAQPVDTD